MLKKLKRYWYRQDKVAYVFLAPSLVVLFLFAFIPLVCSIVIGFMNMDIFFKNISFAGMNNFIQAFQDARFLNAIKNTVIFALVEMPLQVLIGLLIANLLYTNTFTNKMFRSVFFIPVVCSMAAIGVVWSLLLDGNIGMVPYIFNKLFGVDEISYFRDIRTAMPTVILMTVWKNFGYTMSILVVGIQSIPTDYFEAAEIDGANSVQKFFSITIPQLFPSIGFCVITNLIGSLQVFDQVYVTTAGGPQRSTETLVYYIYRTGFTNPFNLGYASAMSVLMLILILALSLPIYLKMFVKER
jgi:multiple sugar transport system permease protein